MAAPVSSHALRSGTRAVTSLCHGRQAWRRCRTVLALALIAAAPATAAERFAGTWQRLRTILKGYGRSTFSVNTHGWSIFGARSLAGKRPEVAITPTCRAFSPGEASTSKIEVTQGSETPHINMDGLVATVQRCEATSLPAQADTPGAGAHLTIDGLFRVGRTGINCYREPCPRVGIVPAYPDGRPSARRPVYSGATDHLWWVTCPISAASSVPGQIRNACWLKDVSGARRTVSRCSMCFGSADVVPFKPALARCTGLPEANVW